MAETTIVTDTYKLFPSPSNRHREVFLHEVFVPYPYALIDLPAFHLKGRHSLFGAYLDSHAGVCPSAVFGLLERTAPRCRNLAGVTFEFHETYFPGLGDQGVLSQLQQMRAAICG